MRLPWLRRRSLPQLGATGNAMQRATAQAGHFAFARFVDRAFGVNGIAALRFAGNALAEAVCVQPDGRILVAGHVINWRRSRNLYLRAYYQMGGRTLRSARTAS